MEDEEMFKIMGGMEEVYRETTLKELKTLMEINSAFTWVSKKDLKEEVIKWVKYYNSLAVVGDMARHNQGIIDGLTKIHNITEEDLKNEN